MFRTDVFQPEISLFFITNQCSVWTITSQWPDTSFILGGMLYVLLYEQANAWSWTACHHIIGDFNFHIDADAGSSIPFHELLEIHGLQQHVTESTHVRGHILDLVITHIDADIISDLLIEDPGISDHSAVFSSCVAKNLHHQAKNLHTKPIGKSTLIAWNRTLHAHLYALNQQKTWTDLYLNITPCWPAY